MVRELDCWEIIAEKKNTHDAGWSRNAEWIKNTPGKQTRTTILKRIPRFTAVRPQAGGRKWFCGRMPGNCALKPTVRSNKHLLAVVGWKGSSLHSTWQRHFLKIDSKKIYILKWIVAHLLRLQCGYSFVNIHHSKVYHFIHEHQPSKLRLTLLWLSLSFISL